MYHPHTQLKPVDDRIGVGVFATQPIPAGTIVYVRDAFDPTFPPGHPLLTDPLYQPLIEKFAYATADGTRVMSWDIGNYINHSCDPNTLSTGYGFEIAIRDIAIDEQITDDYGMFNIYESMTCLCGSAECRDQIQPDDLLSLSSKWDPQIKSALKSVHGVEQPLAGLLDDVTRNALREHEQTGEGYLSVESLYHGKPAGSIGLP